MSQNEERPSGLILAGTRVLLAWLFARTRGEDTMMKRAIQCAVTAIALVVPLVVFAQETASSTSAADESTAAAEAPEAAAARQYAPDPTADHVAFQASLDAITAAASREIAIDRATRIAPVSLTYGIDRL